MSSAQRRFSRHERGTVMVLVAVALVPLIGVLALSIDYGNIVVAQNALQNYVDAKSLAHLKESFRLDVPPVQINAYVPFQTEAADATPEKGAWRFDIRHFDSFTSVRQAGVPAVKVEKAITQPLLLAPFFGVNSQQLQASAVSFVKRRHIVIIQDVSGSMRGNKIRQAKGALRTLVDFMALNPMPGDSMGLIAYHDHLQLNDQLALMDGSRVSRLRNLISGLRHGGNTAPHLGLDAARQQFLANPDELADHVAILVSDGEPRPRENIRKARDARNRLCDPGQNGGAEIQLSTILVDITGRNQPDPCNGGERYDRTDPEEIENVLFTILSRQRVRLVD